MPASSTADERDDRRTIGVDDTRFDRSRTRFPDGEATADRPDRPDGPDGPNGPDDSNDRDRIGTGRTDASLDDGRAVRARTEPMAVYPLRDDDSYLVDTEGGSYVVDLASDRCTCPDHELRHRRCKHLRRVGLEVGIGRVPAPGERVAACAVCGGGVFVPTCETGAFLCGDHRPRPGSFVRDREADKRLVVTGVTTARADEYETPEGRRISDYETNADYGDHEPVVEAVYIDGRLDGDFLDVSGLRRYGFPASRLRRIPPDERPQLPVIGV